MTAAILIWFVAGIRESPNFPWIFAGILLSCALLGAALGSALAMLCVALVRSFTRREDSLRPAIRLGALLGGICSPLVVAYLVLL